MDLMKKLQKRQKLIDNIHEIFIDCKDQNWDGYKADPIDKDLFPAVKYVIDLVCEMFHYSIFNYFEVGPCSDGSILIDLDYKNQSIDFEAIIQNKDSIYFNFKDKKGKKYFKHSKLDDAEQIKDDLKKWLGKGVCI